MQMTNEEIVRDYNAAANKQKQIKVLAELNCTSPGEIRRVLAEADELEANAVTNDIHHALELEEHDPGELLALAEELADTRRRRRTAKDTIAETSPILAWLEDNRAVVKDLERLLGAVRKAERIAENRIYTPRTRRPAAREEAAHGE